VNFIHANQIFSKKFMRRCRVLLILGYIVSILCVIGVVTMKSIIFYIAIGLWFVGLPCMIFGGWKDTA